MADALNHAKSNFLWTFSLLSSLASTLAIVALVRHIADLGSFVAPLELIMSAYASTMQQLFGWAEPYLRDLIARVDDFFNLRLTLYPHWKDVWVMLALIVVGIACALRHDAARWVTICKLAVWGGTGSLATAVVIGMVSLSSPIGAGLAFVLAGAIVALISLSANLALRAPLFGLTLFWGFYLPMLFIFGNLSTWSFTLNPIDFFGFTFAMIIYTGLWSVVEGYFEGSRTDFLIGFNILGGFIGAALFFAVGAGAKLLPIICAARSVQACSYVSHWFGTH
jgi:hypothetical protein